MTVEVFDVIVDNTNIEVTVTPVPEVSVSVVEEVVAVITVAGPAGVRGPAGDGGFTYTQASPAATWTITNTLGRYPAAITVWVSNIQVESDIETPDVSTIVITFSSPQSGRAEII